MEISSMLDAKRGGHKNSVYKLYNTKYASSTSQTNKPDSASFSKAPVAAKEDTNIFKKLSQAEKAEKRSKGLCFNCDEKFVPNHNQVCKGRQGKLFRLSADQNFLEEIEEQEEEEATVEEISTLVEGTQTEISLHAFEGHISSNTIRLKGEISNKSVSVLVDTGSTHNFMQKNVARALKLTIELIVPFNVSTGSGEKLNCAEICRGVEIFIQNTCIKMDIFLLDMSGANLVIGIQGMKTLGPVTFDFDKLLMEFLWKGNKVSWQGLTWISDDPLTVGCLLYTSPSPRDRTRSRMPSSA